MNLSKLLLFMLILNYAKSLNTNKNSENNSDVGFHLPSYMQPDHYDIKLEQEGEERNKIFFRGICTVWVRIYPTHYVHLQAQKPHIELYTNTTILYRVEASEHKIIPNKITYNNATHMYDFFFIKELLKGYYIMQVSFASSLDINEENFFEIHYKNLNGGTESVFATHFRPIGARQLFPCLDEPSYKATFKISIKHFSYYTVLSNMPIQNTVREAMTWTYFNQTLLMPTYHVAIMLFKFSQMLFSRLVEEINISFYTPESKFNTEFAQKVINNVTRHFESEWKHRISFKTLPKVDHVVIPSYRHDGTENWGLIIYRETAIAYDENLDSVARKVEIARLIARKIAYQWILTSPYVWSDAWLYGGIATLLGMNAIDKISPESRIWDLFLVQVQQESLRLDSIIKSLVKEVETPSEINSVFFFSYHLKAPALLRMLQQIISDKVFYDGINIFLNFANSMHLWPSWQREIESNIKSLASPNDLWMAMQSALIISNSKKFDIIEMMNSWIQSKDYPVLKVTQSDSENVKISLENYTYHKNQKIPRIPVTRITSEFTMNQDGSNVIWVSDDPNEHYAHVSTNFKYHWVIVNVKEIGYYRVNYDVQNWETIANFLNNVKDYTKIHVLNRAQIIDDAFYFLVKQQLDLSVFLRLAEYLQRETDYIAWFPMFKALEYMSTSFLFPESKYVKEKMQNILEKLLNNIGYIENSDENNFIKYLKQEAARWACTLGGSRCINNATDKLLWHLINPDKNTLLPWWKRWTYCNGLMFDDSIWSSVFNIWKDSDNGLMEFLSCNSNSYTIYTYLNITVNTTENCNLGNKCKDANMLAKEHVNRFFFIIIKHAKKEVILRYIKENFERIKPKAISTIAALTVIINNLYSKQQFDQVRGLVDYLWTEKLIISLPHTFLDQKMYIKEVNNYIKKGLEYINNCIGKKIIKRESQIRAQKREFQMFMN